MAKQDQRPYQRRPIRRWAPLIAVLALALALGALDRQLKAVDAPGFCPPDPIWTIAADDLGRSWVDLEASTPYQKVTQEVGYPLQSFERYIYLQTGVRPTGARWRTWMGYRFLAANTEEGLGICVRPGVLLRGVHFLRKFTNANSADGQLFQFNEWHYAWRDGFLILSQSSTYVRASLESPPPTGLAATNNTDEIRIQWFAQGGGEVRLRPSEGLPISGWVNVQITNRTSPLILAEAWPQAPALSLSASRWQDAEALYAWIASFGKSNALRNHIEAAADRLSNRWALPPAPPNWDQGMAEFSLALQGVQWEDLVPTPSIALIQRDGRSGLQDHPLNWLNDGLSPTPYEWKGYGGSVAPILGEDWALNLGQYENDWYTTSRSRAMASLTGHLKTGQSVYGDVAIQADWAALGEIVSPPLQTIGEHGLFQRMDRDDVDFHIMPYVRALSQFGHLRIRGRMQNGTLHFEGRLADGSNHDQE